MRDARRSIKAVARGTAVPLLVLIVRGRRGVADMVRPAADADVLPFRIEGEGLTSVREAQATLQLRNAVEAFRLAEGRWPARLERAPGSVRLVAPADALARPPGRPYYFVAAQRRGRSPWRRNAERG